jgi:hypothetical protein
MLGSDGAVFCQLSATLLRPAHLYCRHALTIYVKNFDILVQLGDFCVLPNTTQIRHGKLRSCVQD